MRMELDRTSAGEALDALDTCAQMLDVHLGSIAAALVRTTIKGDNPRHSAEASL